MDEGASWWRRPRVVVTASVVAVVLVAGGLVAAALAGDDGEPQAAPSSSTSVSPTGRPSSDAPSASATPSADATPAEPAPSEPAAAAPPGAVPGPDGRATMPPVPLDATVEPAPSVSARVTALEPVEGVTTVPGEVGGPSVRVTVEVANGTSAPLDLSSAVVNAYYGPELTPARGLLEPGGSPFPASVAPGTSASGVYVFRVPVESRGQVRFELDLAPGATVVLLEGPAPA